MKVTLPDGARVPGRMLLSFRRSGGILIVATVSVALPLWVGVTMIVGGAVSHDPAEWVTGIAVTLAGGILAAWFLPRQFRLGGLTATTLTVGAGRGHRTTVPLSEIDDVGMVYTIPSGWLQYVWRTDGTALRLPLVNLQNYPPNRQTPLRGWQLIAETRQGRACLTIYRAMRSAGHQRRDPGAGARRAGQPNEISFWSADPEIGVLPIVDLSLGRRQQASGIGLGMGHESVVAAAPGPGEDPTTPLARLNDGTRIGENWDGMPRGLRRVRIAAFGLLAVVAAAVLALVVLPPWDSPGWLLPVMIAATVGFFACAFIVKIQKSRAGGLSGIRVQARLWLIFVSLAVLLVGGVGFVVVGQDVGGAASLGAHPAETSVTRVSTPACTGCGSRVEFSTGAGQMTTKLVGSSTASAGDRLVYDPADPQRAMLYADWSAGRGSALWTLLGILVGGIGWIGLLIVSSRRRRQFETLRPGILMTAVKFRTNSGWRVSYADGKHGSYSDTPELRSALQLRLTADGILATVSDKERTLLDDNRGGSIA